MVRIEITEEELSLLTGILERYLGDMSYEIADTDSSTFKEGLRHERDQIADLLARVRNADPLAAS
jgi:hypothetical protein